MIHLVYTSFLKTVALSKLQLYLHIPYIGNRHVHGHMSVPFTSLNVVQLFARTLKSRTNLWAGNCFVCRHAGQAEQS